MPSPYPPDLAFVADLARRAGELALRSYGRIDRETKTSAGERIQGWDPVEAVTEADRASQRLIIEGLRARWPDDGVIGEECDDGSGITNRPPKAGERVWVIDPIDGTNNYVAGLGCFAVCIALLERGAPVLGVVHDVTRGVAYAAAGGRAWLGERETRALATPMSDRSLVMLTCNLLDRRGRLPAFIGRWLETSSWKFRMLGSAALEAVQVGAGVAHAAITVNGKLWDVAAAAAVVLAAGGRVTDLAGKDVFPFSLTDYRGAKVPFLASGPGAHAAVLGEIRDHGWPDADRS
jgi:fructose-1,6-bisphosphatase/inositol monophosphatase family enzyme